GSAELGKSTPQSTISNFESYSKTVMLRPISETPPRAVTRSAPLRGFGGLGRRTVISAPCMAMTHPISAGQDAPRPRPRPLPPRPRPELSAPERPPPFSEWDPFPPLPPPLPEPPPLPGPPLLPGPPFLGDPPPFWPEPPRPRPPWVPCGDRKSTRLNSSHV